MSQTDYYSLCCRYQGETVRITCRDGRIHTGKITRVDRDTVWIQPTGSLGGYGLGWGFRRRGFGVGIAIGTIVGVALASAFFW